jgi:hypothetical protein
MTESLPRCKGCKKLPTKSARSKWCLGCYTKRRRKQLKANNVVWKARVKKGKAGHWVRYNGKPTSWAQQHKTAAIKQVRKYKVAGPLAMKVLEKLAAT